MRFLPDDLKAVLDFDWICHLYFHVATRSEAAQRPASPGPRTVLKAPFNLIRGLGCMRELGAICLVLGLFSLRNYLVAYSDALITNVNGCARYDLGNFFLSLATE